MPGICIRLNKKRDIHVIRFHRKFPNAMYMYNALYDDTFSDEPNRAHCILKSKPVCTIGWNFISFMPTIKRKSVKEDDTVRLLLSLSQIHLHI